MRTSPSGAETILEVEDLKVSFGPVVAVDGLSFTLHSRETMAIVGESGSGKSVTALSIMGLVSLGSRGTIDHGAIRFRRHGGNMIDLVQAPEPVMREVRGNEISMIFQEPLTSLNPVFTVGNQIAETLVLHQGLSRDAAARRAVEMLDLVRIPEAKKRLEEYPHQLSGGMRQRVMIAMALACDPKVLIADEPTTALDVTIQAQILELIRQLQTELDTAVILITHDMGVVAEVADRVTVMNQAKWVEEGDVHGIFDAPKEPYTQTLLRAVPRLGSMRGKSHPAKFELLSDTESARQEPHGMAECSPPEPPDLEGPSETRSDAPALLEVVGLTKRFPIRAGVLRRVVGNVHAVESVSFAIGSGETLALVGESGCGKSTTGNLITRLDTPTAGAVRINGEDIAALDQRALRPYRREMQMIFQDPFASLDPRKTAGHSVTEPLLIHGLGDAQEREAKAADLFAQVGLLPEHMFRYPHQFSGGQRQRICIARALALNPKLLIADEAVSALDVSIQAQVINLMLDLQAELGLSYLFISHDMAVVERISHRVAVMYLGQIVEIGSRENVFSDPRHPYTQRLLSAVPVADPKERNRERTLLTGEIPSPIKPVGHEPILLELHQVDDDHWVATG